MNVQLLATFAVVLVLVFVAVSLNKRRQRQKEAKRKAVAEVESRQMRESQHEAGSEIFAAAKRFKGEVETEGLRVDKFEDNGGDYSIYIGVEDPASFANFFVYRGYPIAQIDIQADEKGSGISAVFGAYSASQTYPLTDAGKRQVIKDVCRAMARSRSRIK